jgi:hypothetical protein
LFDPDCASADLIGGARRRHVRRHGARTGGNKAKSRESRSEVGVGVLICDGCLVLHRDGEIAYCSEELDGKQCAGYDMPHLAGVMACRVTPRGTRCRHCDEVMRIRLITAPDFVPDSLRTFIN